MSRFQSLSNNSYSRGHSRNIHWHHAPLTLDATKAFIVPDQCIPFVPIGVNCDEVQRPRRGSFSFSEHCRDCSRWSTGVVHFDETSPKAGYYRVEAEHPQRCRKQMDKWSTVTFRQRGEIDRCGLNDRHSSQQQFVAASCHDKPPTTLREVTWWCSLSKVTTFAVLFQRSAPAKLPSYVWHFYCAH